MTHDKITCAIIKNRAEQSQLVAELHRIEKQKQNEMRMYDTEKQRFRLKCSRLTLQSSSAQLKQQTSELYETRGSGFDYKENERQKIPQSLQNSSSLNFQQIHNLVFTDDAVDVEKIVCLHMISAHRTETLMPPKKFRYTSMCKWHSPAERLLDRSKRGYNNDEKLSNLLPLYTIELVKSGAMGETAENPLINDGRLAARILVNQKLRALISTVVKALEKCHKEKLTELAGVIQNPNSIKQILANKQHSEFLDSLRDNPLIFSCESFVLTPPFKIKTRDLNIKTATGNLQLLIKRIRENVLQLPKRKILNKIDVEEKEISHPRYLRSDNTTTHRSVMEDSSKVSNETSSVDTNERRSSGEKRKWGRHASTNFIAKNIREAAKARKIEYDTDDATESVTRQSSSTSSSGRSRKSSASIPILNKTFNTGIAAQLTNETIVEEIVEQEETIKEAHIRKDSIATDDDDSKLRKPSQDSNSPKYYIKQTTCPACIERWRTPMPSPKTPRIKRTSIPSPASDNPPLLKTNSRNRINMLINKELFKLDSYDRKYSSDSSSSRRSSYKKQELQSDSSCIINLSPMDLARIEQEIKERETKKKLEKFLNEPL